MPIIITMSILIIVWWSITANADLGLHVEELAEVDVQEVSQQEVRM